jgi:hypothetical protein
MAEKKTSKKSTLEPAPAPKEDYSKQMLAKVHSRKDIRRRRQKKRF